MLNIYKSSSLLIPLLLIMSSACGGDGDDARNVSDRWSGSLIQQSNTCGARSVDSPKIVAASGNFTHNVNQNEDAVDLNDGNGTSFLGNVVSDDGFSVDAVTRQDNSFDINVTCDESQRISYDDINEDSDTTANVTVTTSKECSDGVRCQVVSIGVATRNNVANSPNDDTDGNDDDSANDRTNCNDLAEREYRGDSGCNIGQITTSTNGNIILLNPLGANGATSFTIDATDSTEATAANMDLQILGETGYSCSINCLGQLTFTLDCVQEGGTVCSEKF